MNKIYLPQPIIPDVKSGAKVKINKQQQQQLPTTNQPSFIDVLRQVENANLKFSAHAQKRLADRKIKLDAAEIQKLETALNKAKAKGARESLVLINNQAYVINVPNKVVITAVDETNLKENVFTNIDSAIIM